MSLAWKITDEYFEYNGLTYKRVTIRGRLDATWYRVDGDIETSVVPGEFEVMYQKMKEARPLI